MTLYSNGASHHHRLHTGRSDCVGIADDTNAVVGKLVFAVVSTTAEQFD